MLHGHTADKALLISYVTNVPQGQSNRVGVAVSGSGLDVALLRAGAGERLSAFKVPTVWLLLDDDGDVPRGASGKVDNVRLRHLLRERGTKS